MSDGGIVTAEVNGFTVDSNTAGTKEKLQENLRVKPSEEVSKAGSELGKLGGKAAAEKRAEAKATEDEPERKPIKPIPPKDKAQEAVDEAEKHAEAKMARDAAKEEEPEAKPAEEPEKPEKKGDPRHDPKARMLEATRKEAEAKRALAAEREAKQALESRLAALESEVRRATTETKLAGYDPDDARGRMKAATASDAKPRLEDFVKDAETYEEAQEAYLEARDAWRDRQNQQKRDGEAAQAAMAAQVQAFADAIRPRKDDLSGEVLSMKTEWQLAPGEQPTGVNFLATELAISPKITPQMKLAIMLHLSENPAELQRIDALSNPYEVSREVSKLETRLEAATSGDSTSRDDDVSRAAPPVKPVTGKPYVTEDGYRPGMDLDEYVRMRKRQAKSAR